MRHQLRNVPTIIDRVYLFQQDGKHLLDVDFLERVIAREHAFKRQGGKRTGRELACEQQGKKRQDGTS